MIPLKNTSKKRAWKISRKSWLRGCSNFILNNSRPLVVFSMSALAIIHNILPHSKGVASSRLPYGPQTKKPGNCRRRPSHPHSAISPRTCMLTFHSISTGNSTVPGQTHHIVLVIASTSSHEKELLACHPSLRSESQAATGSTRHTRDPSLRSG